MNRTISSIGLRTLFCIISVIIPRKFLAQSTGVCGSVSPCDLVQNGGFENNSGCGSTLNSATLASCWLASSLSPDLFVRGCTTSTPPANLGNNTYSSTIVFDSFNSSPNNAVIGMGGAITSGNTQLDLSESLANYLGSPTINNQAYTLSFWAYQFVGSKSDPDYMTNATTYPPQSFNSSSVSAVLSFATNSVYISSPYQTFPYPGLTTIQSVTLSNVFNTWKHYTITFTATAVAPGSWLYIGMDKNLTYNHLLSSLGINAIGEYFFYTLIDDVSLRKSSVAPQLKIPSQICTGQSLTNLQQYVNPQGGTFSGPGISTITVPSTSGTTTHYNFNSASTLTNGIYAVIYTYTDAINCPQTAIQQVSVGNTANGLPLVYVSSSSCVNSGTLSVVSPAANTTYSWQPGNFQGTSIIVNPNFVTSYSVLGTNGSTCYVAGNSKVIPNKPYAQIGLDAQSQCAGSSVQLNATGNFTSIVWQPGNMNTAMVIVSPSVTTNYSVYITSSAGCTVMSVKTVSVLPSSIYISVSNPSICAGQAATLTASGGANYFWYHNPVDSLSSVVYPSSTTVYSLNGLNSNNCYSTATATVYVYNPYISTSRPTTICKGESITLTAVAGANSYAWNPPNLYTQAITVSPNITTNYTVQTTNYFSSTPCSLRTTMLVTVLPCTAIEEAKINFQSFSFFPNPNDGTFTIISDRDEPTEVSIYNEAGQCVKKLNIGSSKDSYRMVTDLPPGFYFLESKCIYAKLIISK
ncbi:hypothetical protein CNR22_20900 [Sphingobacteriaceae bacterium]|nr:hypothetical protein CNR22_20900 [Sphingobacteriaceae bacterium]